MHLNNDNGTRTLIPNQICYVYLCVCWTNVGKILENDIFREIRIPFNGICPKKTIYKRINYVHLYRIAIVERGRMKKQLVYQIKVCSDKKTTNKSNKWWNTATFICIKLLISIKSTVVVTFVVVVVKWKFEFRNS